MWKYSHISHTDRFQKFSDTILIKKQMSKVFIISLIFSRILISFLSFLMIYFFILFIWQIQQNKLATS